MAGSENKTADFVAVICVDNSENAHAAFEFYTNTLHKPNHKVILLLVSDAINVPSMYFLSEAMVYNQDEIDIEAAKIKKKNQNIVDKYNGDCAKIQLDHKFIVISSDPGIGEAIVKKVKELNASMVVMGTRGLGAVRRTLLGSVSDYVLHHSHLPVVICPPSK